MESESDFTKSSWQCIHFIDTTQLSIFIERLRASDILIMEAEVGDVRTESQLFSAISQAMRFPSYFGGNWDALEECLRDMDWLHGKGYVLVLHGGKELWRNATQLAGSLVGSWLFCAEEWGRNDVPFHLIFLP